MSPPGAERRRIAPAARAPVWIPLALVPVALLPLEPTGLDLKLQDLLWTDGAPGHWLVDADSFWPRLVFYRLIRWLVIATGVGALVMAVASCAMPRLSAWRRRFLCLALSVALVPGLAGALKAVTDVHCPAQLMRYGGDQPYDGLVPRLFQPVATTTAGRCFPAGHAAGGFALLALGWLARDGRWRLAGFAAGIGAGWIAGLYQMSKGAHFLSHTVTTMLLALAVTAWLAGVVRREKPGSTPDDGSAA